MAALAMRSREGSPTQQDGGEGLDEALEASLDVNWKSETTSSL